VPDVLVARDIGAPPRYIDDVVEHVVTEMRDPRLHRRYKQRACVTKLLAGVSGSGKTLSINALWRRLYEVMADETGVAVENLPPRVMRLRPSGVLSEWLGRSDKNLDQFFDEAEALADETFVGLDGRAHRLPVLAILEEIDALGHARGNDTVYDRILSTALDRLDAGRASLKGRLVIFLATTNVPHQVDPALLRRIGGTVERFGRLTRRGFAAVLAKHVDGLPFMTGDASREAEARRSAASDVTGWLFSPNGTDKGQVEVHFVGSPTPAIKKRRDFLTGALVDRAVQEAARAACRAERDGAERPGLDRALLMDAFDRQIRAVVDQLDPANAHNFLDLPDGVRVASIRRIARPAVLPFELERVS
jgi:SpoVK/Ycf46/Vps4 family AAA+-type ATPase